MSRWRRALWRHPEWWALALSAVAWVLMLRPHFHHQRGAWMTMTVAMMLPMVIPSIRTTAERSLWRRRDRAIAFFLLGYLACWALVGVAVTLLPPLPYAGAIALAIAAAWQLTRAKRIALAGCHYTMPLAPRGWRADRDCVRYGASIGTRCVMSCWALMLLCALAGHALVVCAGIMAFGYLERVRPWRRWALHRRVRPLTAQPA